MRAELFNRQRQVALDLKRLQALASAACVACRPHAGRGLAVLPQLPTVEISLVSDRTISRVHRQFLQVPGPTDVITFAHGEIVISVATADKQARRENEPLDREVARYIIHGILHLNGHLDQQPGDASRMWRVQEAVLQSLWPQA